MLLKSQYFVSERPKAQKVPFFRKYFLAGQQMSDPSAHEVPENADFIDRFLITKRKYIAFALPVITMHVLWWLTAYRYNWFPLFGYRWQMPVVMFFGSTIAGIFTSFAGSGVDICIFAITTLLFRVSEKTATPTTVVLMGLNSMVGFYCRLIWYGNVTDLTVEYLKVSIPVAVTMAPIGSFIGSHFHRQVKHRYTSSSDITKRMAPARIIVGAGIIAIAFVFFSFVSKMGELLLEKIESKKDLSQNAAPVPLRM
ncbi:hypothetical protein OESDEN_15298 [Oesophagostomum dentatum]|uniref:Uncharacterized protein n=1 Tax=Oesophagostomum dentatum TaxID=61180 RepID=A0A0B1SN83_OESDE|nr:hypothetical protein OESDEN_15298 [Oesophagostomum dentatum]